MNFEFIPLCKLGVGTVLVRYSDIITMELTPYGYTRIEFGYGEHLIVEDTPLRIFELVRATEELKKEEEKTTNNIGDQSPQN